MENYVHYLERAEFKETEMVSENYRLYFFEVSTPRFSKLYQVESSLNFWVLQETKLIVARKANRERPFENPTNKIIRLAFLIFSYIFQGKRLLIVCDKISNIYLADYLSAKI